MTRAIKDEKGAALALALVLLVVGGLVLAPLLGLMSTGLMAGQVYEKKTDELYAADAGVEDALWRIGNESIAHGSWNTSLDRPGWQIYKYPKPLSVNGKSVEVVVYRKDWDYTCGENLTYQILSTAITDDGGGAAAIRSSTTIESYVDAKIVVRNLLDNAITSMGGVEIGSNSVVGGDVQYSTTLKPDAQGINGTVTQEQYRFWPGENISKICDYYLGNVDPAKPYPSDSIDISQNSTIGPLYWKGGLLTISNQGSGTMLSLTDTVYVDGDLRFKQPGSKNYTLNLSGETIFVTGSIDLPSSAGVTVSGSGCIIAIRDVNFQPGMQGTPNDFVFVMSLLGTLTFKPRGTFYGSLAGDLKVDLQPNSTMTWTSWADKGINFPVADYAYASQIVETLAIRTWEIGPQ